MDYLSQDELTKLEGLKQTDSFTVETLVQLDRILASTPFRSLRERAKDFLGFVVKKRLLGLTDDIKETTIAIHVFGESADYNPLEHTKVREAGGNLRERLHAFYADEGVDEPIYIVIPLRTYVPQIQDRRQSIGVSVFENWNPAGDQEHLCQAVADEIVHRFGNLRRLNAQRIAEVPQDGDHPDYLLRGSLECLDQTVRLNYSLSDLGALRILASDHITGHREELLKLAQHVASSAITRMQHSISKPGKPRPSSSSSNHRRKATKS
jgi:TolB-like protein